MTWWQTALTVWGVGAFAAFPVAFEFNQSTDFPDFHPLSVPTLIGVSALAALGWPIAWTALAYYAVHKAWLKLAGS